MCRNPRAVCSVLTSPSRTADIRSREFTTTKAGILSCVHLWRRRSADTLVASVDDMWVDIGARSAAEARARGIEMLDPIVREWPSWRYGEFVAGPGAASRAGCAAVAAASRQTPASGETVYILAAQSAFNHVGDRKSVV